MNKEKWKQIEGYEGMYEVSDQGRVKSFLSKKVIIMKTNVKEWYSLASLKKDKMVSRKYVHRIVANAFLDGFVESLNVDHINGIKSDNRVTNLRILNKAENSRAFKTKIKNTTSKYRGVSWNVKINKWSARIGINGKTTYIGVFHNEVDAAKAYNSKAIELGFFPEALNKIDYRSTT